jgi:hypothetical protein
MYTLESSQRLLDTHMSLSCECLKLFVFITPSLISAPEIQALWSLGILSSISQLSDSTWSYTAASLFQGCLFQAESRTEMGQNEAYYFCFMSAWILAWLPFIQCQNTLLYIYYLDILIVSEGGTTLICVQIHLNHVEMYISVTTNETESFAFL